MGEAQRKLEEKKKAFAENPMRFLDKKDLIFAAAFLPDGRVGVILNPAKKREYYIGLGDLQRRINNALNLEEIKAAANKKPKLEVPDSPNDIIGDQSA